MKQHKQSQNYQNNFLFPKTLWFVSDQRCHKIVSIAHYQKSLAFPVNHQQETSSDIQSSETIKVKGTHRKYYINMHSLSTMLESMINTKTSIWWLDLFSYYVFTGSKSCVNSKVLIWLFSFKFYLLMSLTHNLCVYLLILCFFRVWLMHIGELLSGRKIEKRS